MEHQLYLNNSVHRTTVVWVLTPLHTYLWLDSVASGSLGLCPVSPGWGPELSSSRTVVWSSDPPCARAARLDLDKEPRDIAIMFNQYTDEQEAMHLIIFYCFKIALFVQYTNTCQQIDNTPPPFYKVCSKVFHKSMAIFDLSTYIYPVPLKSERSKEKIS